MYYFFACAMLLLSIVSTGLVSTQLYLLFAGVFVVIAVMDDIKKILEEKKDDDKDS